MRARTPRDREQMRARALRDRCVREYGEEFGELYDMLGRGEFIGGVHEITDFIVKLDNVWKQMESESVVGRIKLAMRRLLGADE